MRLDRLLAQAAGLSRSQAREAIRAGRVLVAGQAVTSLDAQANPGVELLLDGQMLASQTTWHLMLYKPKGLLTAARDARAATVMDLLPESMKKARCMPVGRLDKDTEGLLLFTTDGELAHRLLSPRRQIAKLYQARVEGRLDAADVAAFSQGIVLQDFVALPALLSILEAGDDTSLATAQLTEGKHRQVRRMFGALGHEVLELTRLQFGPLTLDPALAPGEYRELHPHEVQALKESVHLV